MSEIQRYKMEFAPGSGGWIKQTARGELVLFTDHEAAIEQVLADARARIEGLKGHNLYRNVAIDDCLAALTQPQTERERFGSRPYTPEQREFMEKVVSERPPLPQPVFPLEDDGGGAAAEKCPEDCDGFGQLIGDSDGPCPACSGLEPDRGGAATAAGAADADLELPLTDSTLVEEVVAAVYEACLDRAMDDPDAIEVAAVLRGELTGTRAATEPGPYAKAFRERVCPVPEFPGIENPTKGQA